MFPLEFSLLYKWITKNKMKTDTPVFQITSLLLMLGPIVLFWYIDWYWIVGYYNLYFTYTCYVLYKQYDSDSNYWKKYHFIVYVVAKYDKLYE